MPYPPDNKPEFPKGEVRSESEAVKNDPEIPVETRKGFKWTLWPRRAEKPHREAQEKQDQPSWDGWEWLKDWSDLLILFPIMLLGFLTASFWIRKVDPTSQVLDPENLTVLNWNLMVLFGSSGVLFLLWKIWVGGSVFSEAWFVGLTPYEKMKVKLMFLGGAAIYVAFMLTRNL